MLPDMQNQRKLLINNLLRIFLPALFLFVATLAQGQEKRNEFSGKVTYMTSQHIYARFDGTNDLQVGDTIFIRNESGLKPLMLIESKSSYSVVGQPFPDVEVSLGQEIVGRSGRKAEPEAKIDKIQSASKKEEAETVVDSLSRKAEPEVKVEKVQFASKKRKSEAAADSVSRAPKTSEFKQKIRGRISLSSYSSFSNATSSDSHRMRYSLSLQANNINNSRFSAEAYTNFSYLASSWSVVPDSLFNALKVYSLAVRYQAGDQTDIWLGRKINPNLSNIGAIDGLQVETGLKNFRFGGIAGFRPDYSDYGFNSDLLEYGAYLVHQYKNGLGAMRSSLAFFNQTNNGKTDRRFLYLQHTNSLAKNVFLFLSSEVDLYKKQDSISANTFRLTSFYASLRYRINQQLWVDASYDNRKNVIYYETFKNWVDQLMDEATRQGVQLRINYRPVRLVTIGLNSSYRKRDTDPKASTSYHGFLSFNQVPKLDATITLSANRLKTVYLDGSVFGLRVYKDFWDGKLYSTLGYRHVDYQFTGSGASLLQHVGELDLSWRIARKLSLSVNYEATFEKKDNYNRIYINLTKRF